MGLGIISWLSLRIGRDDGTGRNEVNDDVCIFIGPDWTVYWTSEAFGKIVDERVSLSSRWIRLGSVMLCYGMESNENAA